MNKHVVYVFIKTAPFSEKASHIEITTTIVLEMKFQSFERKKCFRCIDIYSFVLFSSILKRVEENDGLGRCGVMRYHFVDFVTGPFAFHILNVFCLVQ